MLNRMGLSAARACARAAASQGCPVHRIVGVLQQVGAGFVNQSVGHRGYALPENLVQSLPAMPQHTRCRPAPSCLLANAKSRNTGIRNAESG